MPPLIFGAITIFYLSNAGGFSDPTSGQAPHLYGQALLALSVLVFAIALLRSVRSAPLRHDNNENFPRAVGIYAILAGFVGFILIAGLYIAVPLFLLLFFLLITRMKFWAAVIGALLGLLLLWGVFGRLLHMQIFVAEGPTLNFVVAQNDTHITSQATATCCRTIIF